MSKMTPLLVEIQNSESFPYPEIQKKIKNYLSHDYIFSREAEVPQRVNLKLDKYLFERVYKKVDAKRPYKEKMWEFKTTREEFGEERNLLNQFSRILKLPKIYKTNR